MIKANLTYLTWETRFVNCYHYSSLNSLCPGDFKRTEEKAEIQAIITATIKRFLIVIVKVTKF